MKVSFSILCLLLFIGCNNKKRINKNPKDCIANVLKIDDSLGKIRNHECESKPLTITINNYINGLNSIDFSMCPIDFKTSFKNHVKAWNQMTEVVKNHNDIRGEMHDLFDKIAISKDSVIFKQHLSAIWSTWEKVEKAKEKNL